MKTNRIVLLCAALLGGCGAGGPGVVHLTVNANPPVTNIDHFHIVVSNNGMTAHPIDLPLNGRPLSIPPAHTVDLTFGSDRSGAATINLEAVDANGNVLATGVGQAAIDQTKDTSATLTLGTPAIVGNDMATQDDMATTRPADMANTGEPDMTRAISDDMAGESPDMAMELPDMAMEPPDMVLVAHPDMVVVPDMTMLAPPSVTDVAPPNGPTTGGIMLTISGNNFFTGATVTIGGAAAMNVVVVSPKKLTATLPVNPGKIGLVPIVVTNPDGHSGTINNAFSYYPGTLGFVAGKKIAVGTNPITLVLADFNLDGKNDVATANLGSSDVSVLLWIGPGNFAAAVSYPVTGAGQIAIGDLNKDGSLDLLVTDGVHGNVSTLLGKRDGTFLAAKATYLGVLNVGGIVAGDFNRDGILDALTTNGGANGHGVGLYFSAGVGDGTFQDVVYTAASVAGPAVADMNGDGKLDAITANGLVFESLGNGDGTFQADSTFAASNAIGDVGLGDFNGDGRPDVVAVNYLAKSVSVLTNNGGMGLNNAVNFAVGSNPSQQAIGDMNLDGNLDVAVTNGNDNTVSVLLGKGDGTFSVQQVFATGTAPRGIAIGDVDGDGKPDIVVGNDADGDILILLNSSQ